MRRILRWRQVAWLVVPVAGMVATGCGSSTATTVTVSVTRTVTVQKQASAATTSSHSFTSKVKESENPKDQPTITVETTRLFFLPNQVGGHFHVAVGLIRNNSGSAREVSGQFSIHDAKGLVGTADAVPVTVPAHAESVLLADSVKLPRAVTSGSAAKLVVSDDDPYEALTPVRFSGAHYVPGGGVFNSCALVVRAVSRATKKVSVQILAIALDGARIVSAESTYEDLYPGTPDVVTLSMDSDALCPKSVTSVRAFVG